MSIIHALVIAVDYEARPWWCPRWFLRFLHLFGNDNSLVRVRNFRLNRLHTKITKGIFMWDYKTKWQWFRRFEPDFKVWKTNQELRQYLDTLYEKENNE